MKNTGRALGSACEYNKG